MPGPAHSTACSAAVLRVHLAADGRVVECDPGFARLMHSSEASLLGVQFWQLGAADVPDEPTHVREARGSYHKALPGGGSLRVLPVPNADGMLLWCEPTAALAESREQALLELTRSDALDGASTDRAFDAIATVAARGLNVTRASVWLLDDTRKRLVCHSLYDARTPGYARGTQLTAADYPAYFRALENSRTLIATDARTHPATAAMTAGYLEPLGIASMLEAPIRKDGALLGVLCSEHVGQPRPFSAADAVFAGTLADTATRALLAHERTKANDALVKAHAHLERRVEAQTRHLTRTLDAMGDGLLVVAPDGMLRQESSRVARLWFGSPPDKVTLWDYLARHDPRLHTELRICFEDFVDPVLPLDLRMAQLPQTMRSGRRAYRMQWRAVMDGPALEHIVLLLTDIGRASDTEFDTAIAPRDITDIDAALRALRDPQPLSALLAHLDRLVHIALGEENRALAVAAQSMHHTVHLTGSLPTHAMDALHRAAHRPPPARRARDAQNAV